MHIPRKGKVTYLQRGSTDDVVEAMKKMVRMSARHPYVQQIFRDYLMGYDEAYQAEKIFNYAYQVAHFYPHPSDTQTIRSAIRTIEDGYANCVDYSVLISTLLTLCGITHYFRRVSFGNSKQFNHIYIVLYDGTPLDAVIGQREDGKEEHFRENLNGFFGQEVDFAESLDTLAYENRTS